MPHQDRASPQPLALANEVVGCAASQIDELELRTLRRRRRRKDKTCTIDRASVGELDAARAPLPSRVWIIDAARAAGTDLAEARFDESTRAQLALCSGEPASEIA